MTREQSQKERKRKQPQKREAKVVLTLPADDQPWLIVPLHCLLESLLDELHHKTLTEKVKLQL